MGRKGDDRWTPTFSPQPLLRLLLIPLRTRIKLYGNEIGSVIVTGANIWHNFMLIFLKGLIIGQLSIQQPSDNDELIMDWNNHHHHHTAL